jgi:hypothetical protein
MLQDTRHALCSLAKRPSSGVLTVVHEQRRSAATVVVPGFDSLSAR